MHRPNAARPEPSVDENEFPFSSAVQIAPAAIIGVDTKQRILVFNREAARLFRYEPADVIDQPVQSVLPGFSVPSGESLPDALGAAAVEGNGGQRRMMGRRRDGSVFAIEASVAPVSNGVRPVLAIFVREIPGPEETDGALLAVEARYHRVIEGMLEGFQLISHDWRYLFVNEVVVRHGQRSREELLGRTMMEAYPGIDRTPLFEVLRQCMERRAPQHMENEFTYPDGSSRWFDLSIQPAPEGLLILSTDITERKQAELRVLRQIDHLRALRNIDIAIADSHEVNRTLEVVVRETAGKLGTDAACVMVHRAHTSTLVVGACEGFHSAAMQRQEVRLGEGLAGRCAVDRRILHVPDLGMESDSFTRAEAVAGEGFVTWIGAPLLAKGEIRGVLEVYHRSPLNPDAEWFRFFETLAGQAAIAIDSALAFEELHRTNIELHLAYEATIEGWSRAMDLRDRETEGHTLRVTEMTLQVARAAGMTESELTQVRRGALLHDIGKLAVPDRILHKAGTLTEDEWVVMRQHPTYAYDMLFPINYLRDALDIPYCHHERWDGTGYPRGLKGKEIPHAARLFSVVDVWDALRSDRPYRPAWSEEKVLDYIRNAAGTHLDPEAVELFLRVVGGGVPEPHPVIGTCW